MDFKVNVEGMVNSHMFSAEGMGKGNIFAYVSHKFIMACDKIAAIAEIFHRYSHDYDGKPARLSKTSLQAKPVLNPFRILSCNCKF